MVRFAALLATTLTYLAGCGPSASVKQTAPVANLQQYRQVLIRVAGDQNTERHHGSLGAWSAYYIQQHCKFENVAVNSATGKKPDLILDLNLRRSYRGGAGLLQNMNQATVNVAMILSDGVNDDLLGSATITGRSSAVQTQIGAGQVSPEDQALDAVAKQVGRIMKSSGCGLVRVARAKAPAPQPAVATTETTQGDPGNSVGDSSNAGNSGSDSSNADNAGNESNNAGNSGDSPTADPTETPPAGPSKQAEAEALNEAGKKEFRAAHPGKAAEKFQQAVDMHPTAKYYYNLCLANEAQKKFGPALSACQKVQDNNPDSALANKAKARTKRLRQQT